MFLHPADIVCVIDKSDKVASLSGHTRSELDINAVFDIVKKRGATTVYRVSTSNDVLDFFKYGQTWYEKYFGFQPEAKYTERYACAKEIQKTIGLETKPCSYFTNDVLDDLLAETKLVFLYNVVWEKHL
jgi:hypothetical protein